MRNDDVVATIQTTGGTMKIRYDNDAESPREGECNLGTIYHWHPKYNLGVRIGHDTPMPKGVKLPVFMFDHSGVALSTRPFGDPWDSGQVGWIVAPTEAVCVEYGCKRITPTIRRKVIARLAGEIDTYSKYLGGEVYGYTLEKPVPPCEACGRSHEPEVEDSCWGFIGDLREVKAYMLEQAGVTEV